MGTNRVFSIFVRYCSRIFDREQDFATCMISAMDGDTAIENLLTLDTAPKHGVSTDGARARPPEDVGGVAEWRI